MSGHSCLTLQMQGQPMSTVRGWGWGRLCLTRGFAGSVKSFRICLLFGIMSEGWGWYELFRTLGRLLTYPFLSFLCLVRLKWSNLQSKTDFTNSSQEKVLTFATVLLIKLKLIEMPLGRSQENLNLVVTKCYNNFLYMSYSWNVWYTFNENSDQRV